MFLLVATIYPNHLGESVLFWHVTRGHYGDTVLDDLAFVRVGRWEVGDLLLPKLRVQRQERMFCQAGKVSGAMRGLFGKVAANLHIFDAYAKLR